MSSYCWLISNLRQQLVICKQTCQVWRQKASILSRLLCFDRSRSKSSTQHLRVTHATFPRPVFPLQKFWLDFGITFICCGKADGYECTFACFWCGDVVYRSLLRHSFVLLPRNPLLVANPKVDFISRCLLFPEKKYLAMILFCRMTNPLNK